jgi:hypothetical protein
MDTSLRGLSYSTQRRRVNKTIEHTLSSLSGSFNCGTDAADLGNDEWSVEANVEAESCVSSVNFAATDKRECDVGAASASFDGNDDQDFVYDDDDDDNDDDYFDLNLHFDDQRPLATKLAEWAVGNSISLLALSALLSILQPYHEQLPRDARTLLKTPKTYEIRNLTNNEGQYHHFGIQNGIMSCLKHVDNLMSEITLNLQFNVDGLPLFKSSCTEFWPILCMVKQSAAKPFLVGLYCGRKKPIDLADFLKDFLSELEHLLSNGFRCENTFVKIVIDCFVCDAPARAYMKNVKSHCAYFGCDKCKQEGEYVKGRMTFPLTNAALRSDADFLTQTDEEHHKGTTPLSKLPIGLVSGFVLDYMHMVCLGIVRRVLHFWLRGPVSSSIRLQSRLVQVLSDKLMDLVHAVPREFARRPRSVSEIDRWKAVEFRQFLLYTGMVVLPGIVSEEVFNHFMLLSVGIRLLAHPVHHSCFNTYAHQLLEMFVKQSSILYGPEFVVYNVHSLVHLSAEVKAHGCLDSFSAFPFENELKTLKHLVRRAEGPLSQVIRRLSELQGFHRKPVLSFASSCIPKFEHCRGPVPDGYCSGRQFQKLQYKTMYIQCNSPDNCVVVKNFGPVVVENIIQMPNHDLYLVCKMFCNQSSLFSYPLDSTNLHILKVTGLSDECTTVPVTDIEVKCAKLPFGRNSSQFAVIPLLHS